MKQLYVLNTANTTNKAQFLLDNSAVIIQEYVTTEASKRYLFHKCKALCNTIVMYDITKLLSGIKKVTPWRLVVEAALDEATSPQGISTVTLREIMTQYYGTRFCHIQKRTVPNYTSEDYAQVAFNLRNKAKYKGLKAKIVPIYMHGLDVTQVEDMAFNDIPELVKATRDHFNSDLFKAVAKKYNLDDYKLEALQAHVSKRVIAQLSMSGVISQQQRLEAVAHALMDDLPKE